MSLFGVLLMAAGAALLLAVNGDTAHSLGVATLIVGAALIVLAAVRAALRLVGVGRRAMRYQDGEDFSDGIPPDYRTNRAKIAAMILVVLYLFSPIDLAVLELLLPVGVVGDTGAVAWLALTTGKEVTRHRQARRLRRSISHERRAIS